MEHIFMEEEQIILDNEIINLVNEINPERKKYVIKPHMDNLHIWDDKEFLRRFRVSKNTVLDIVAKIEEPLTHRTNRNHAVQPLQQLLLTLRYFATANFYITVADFGGLHKSTVGKIIPRVVYALTRLRHQYIAMPQTREEKEATAVEFHRVARFPRVVGAIDCTHVRLQSPGGNMAENFRNRKGYFSLNVQVVCNATTKITDVVVRWPGSTHDSYIFNNSAVRVKFETEEVNNWILLGDSGYPLRPYLLTPLDNPNTAAEHLYNEAQIRTRNIVERTFGIWKRRFPILSMGIRTKVPLAQAIVVATTIIHNIASQNHDELPQNEEDIINDIPNNPVGQEDEAGATVRTSFINYFEQLLLN